MKLSLDLSKIWKRFLILLFAFSFSFWVPLMVEMMAEGFDGDGIVLMIIASSGISVILCFPTWIHWVAKEIASGWKEGMNQEDNNEE